MNDPRHILDQEPRIIKVRNARPTLLPIAGCDDPPAACIDYEGSPYKFIRREDDLAVFQILTAQEVTNVLDNYRKLGIKPE